MKVMVVPISMPANTLFSQTAAAHGLAGASSPEHSPTQTRK